MNVAPPVIIDADEPLSKAVSLVRQSGTGVLVMRGKQYLGVIDEKQLASAPKDTSKSKCCKLAVRTPVILPNMPLLKIVEAFFAGRFKTLPVIEGQKVLGTVSRWDVLSELASSGLLSGHRVSDFMTSPVVAISPDTLVGKAKAMMRERNIRRLVVMDGGRIRGIISNFDLTRIYFAKPVRVPEMRAKLSDERRSVSSFMRSDVEVIGKSDSLAAAVSKMLSTQVAALIVLEGQLPIGILTTKDVLEAVMRTESEGKVFVSGIHGFEESAEEVYDECSLFVEKEGKSNQIDALNLHVKKTGRQYFVSGHIHGRKGFLASSSGWSLEDAVRGTLSELGTQMQKEKTKKLGRKKQPE